MYELYSEIVYEIVNAVGRDAAIKGGREVLLSYLQEAFNIDSDKHDLLLEKIKERKVKQSMRKIFEFYTRNNDQSRLEFQLLLTYLLHGAESFLRS